MGLSEAAASGDQLKLLIAMRTLIADTLADDECPIRDISPLTRRLQEVSDRIAALEERERQEVRRDRSSRKDGNWDPGAI